MKWNKNDCMNWKYNFYTFLIFNLVYFQNHHTNTVEKLVDQYNEAHVLPSIKFSLLCLTDVHAPSVATIVPKHRWATDTDSLWKSPGRRLYLVLQCLEHVLTHSLVFTPATCKGTCYTLASTYDNLYGSVMVSNIYIISFLHLYYSYSLYIMTTELQWMKFCMTAIY